MAPHKPPLGKLDKGDEVVLHCRDTDEVFRATVTSVYCAPLHHDRVYVKIHGVPNQGCKLWLNLDERGEPIHATNPSFYHRFKTYYVTKVEYSLRCLAEAEVDL